MHLENLQEKYPEEVQEILRRLYVDDILTGGSTKDEVQNLKKTITSVFGEAKFTLHKWNSNEPQLENEDVPSVDNSSGSQQERKNVPPVDNSSRTQLECGNAPIVDEQQSYTKHKLGVKEGE